MAGSSTSTAAFVGRLQGRPLGVVLIPFALMASCGLANRTSAEEAPEEGMDTAEAGPSDDSLVVEVQRAVGSVTHQIEANETALTFRFADDHDWMRTNSGEWVRGAIDWMRDDIMEFDSDEFGTLEVHMRDVGAVHSPRVNTYVFENRESLRGRAFITKSSVVVETKNGTEIRSRDSLWAIVEGGTRELDYWSGALSLGLSGNRGNSSQVDFNLALRIEREDRRTLNRLDYLMNLGRAEGEPTVNRNLLSFESIVWLSQRWFVNPVLAQLLNDRFQDIRFRAQPAAGAGLRFLHTPHVWWNLSAGIGYQYLSLVDPSATVENPQHDGLGRFATGARFDITLDIYLLINWVSNVTFTTIGNTNHTGTADLFFEITNVLNLQATFLYLRTEEPLQRADGTVPQKNDYLFILGIALQLG